jgi:hypothetical protein
MLAKLIVNGQQVCIQGRDRGLPFSFQALKFLLQNRLLARQ